MTKTSQTTKTQRIKVKKKVPQKRPDLKALQDLAAEYGFSLEPMRMGPRSVYDPNFHPADFIRLSAEGKTKAQICASWGIHRDTLHDWIRTRDYKDLSDAVKRGEELRSQWWTNLATGIAAGRVPGAKEAMTIFLMKNICPNDFRDRIDHSHTLDVEEMEFGE